MEELNFAELCRKTALAVHDQHLALASRGTVTAGRNRFGKLSFLAGLIAERRIIDIMRDMGLRARVIGEEHAPRTIGIGEPQFTLIMDGLDGSTVYAASSPESRTNGTARYGTMFAMYPGENFRFGDALASCLIEHSTRRLFLSTPAGTRIELIGEDYEQPLSIQPQSLNYASIIHCNSEDPAWGDLLRQEIVHPLNQAGYSPRVTSAAARQYADVLTGKAVATIQWTRHGNLEVAAAHQLITGAGGVVMHMNGTHLSDIYYHKFSKNPDNVEFFIAACSNEVAEKLAWLISRYS